MKPYFVKLHFSQDDYRAEAVGASRRSGLTEAQYGRFTLMLEDLDPSRTKIGDVMVWCLEHADSAADITNCVLKSVEFHDKNIQFNDESSVAADQDGTDFETKPPDDSTGKKSLTTISKIVARLFLASDILYNSSAKVPNASHFRKW